MSVTRSTNQIQVQLDFEIENTLRRLRKEARLNTMAVARQQILAPLPGSLLLLTWKLITTNSRIRRCRGRTN